MSHSRGEMLDRIRIQLQGVGGRREYWGKSPEQIPDIPGSCLSADWIYLNLTSNRSEPLIPHWPLSWLLKDLDTSGSHGKQTNRHGSNSFNSHQSVSPITSHIEHYYLYYSYTALVVLGYITQLHSHSSTVCIFMNFPAKFNMYPPLLSAKMWCYCCYQNLTEMLVRRKGEFY